MMKGVGSCLWPPQKVQPADLRSCSTQLHQHPTASACLEDSPDLGTTEPDRVMAAADNVFKMSFSGLEVQRSQLESRVGTDALLKVYKMMVEFDGKSLDDRLVYSDFQDILKHGDDDDAD